MPILYVHGVNVRDRKGFQDVLPYLRRLVAPAISPDPGGVAIEDVFWGDVAARFAWNGAARPRSRLLGQGADADEIPERTALATAASFRDALGRLPEPAAPPQRGGGLISGAAAPAASAAAAIALRDLEPDALSDVLAVVLDVFVEDPAAKASLTLAADEVARDPATAAALAKARDPEEELAVLLERISARLDADATLAGMGGVADRFRGIGDRIGEALGRAGSLPSYAMSVLASELRKPLNETFSVFLGDVFVYLAKRGSAGAPGPIQQRLLAGLRQAQANKAARGGEPLVVLTHSMGGQLVYDAVTHFVPGDPALADLEIEFWCASASQVGLFEELKLFRASVDAHRVGSPVPYPAAHLGAWWNVWDHNDFLSFTVADIVAGVDDGPYDSGMSLLAAHGGYLKRPTFFRELARRIRAAAARDWKQS